jgi:CheY-like chemotaxis protein
MRQRLEQLAAAPDPDQLASLASEMVEIEARLNDARLGADRMRDILATLRGFARPMEGVTGVVPLVDAIEAAIRLTSNQIALRGYVVREFHAAPLVCGHQGQLCQVFTNLLSNAAQAMAEGNGPQRPIRIVVTASEADAIVEIIDAGEGIPAEVMVRIFEPFFTTKPIGGGTGLGLAIVHTILQAHQGEVAVTSKPHEGSTFRVRLPLAPPSPARVAEVAVRPEPSRRAVLIVDDDVAVGRLLRRMLEAHHDVSVVTSGREALERLRDHPPDVIVSDLMMAEMTGIEFHAHLLAEHPEHARRMLFLTGGAFTPATHAFVAEMSDRILLKPVSLGDLLAAIEAALVRPT